MAPSKNKKMETTMGAHHIDLSQFFAYQALAMGENTQKAVTFATPTSTYLGRRIVNISGNSSINKLHQLTEKERVKALFDDYRKGNIVVVSETAINSAAPQVFGTKAAKELIIELKKSSDSNALEIIYSLFPSLRASKAANEPDANDEESSDVTNEEAAILDINETDENELDELEQSALTQVEEELQRIEAQSKRHTAQSSSEFHAESLLKAPSQQKKPSRINKSFEHLLSPEQLAHKSLTKITQQAIKNFEKAAREEKERYEEDSKKQETASEIRKSEQKKTDAKNEAIAKDIATQGLKKPYLAKQKKTSA